MKFLRGRRLTCFVALVAGIGSGVFLGVADNIRAQTAGSLDTSFNPGTDVTSDVRAIAVQPDGKILLSGNFTNLGGVAHVRIARVAPDGTPDAGFNPSATGSSSTSVGALALQADGKVLIGGGFKTVDNVARTGIARLNADGSLDLGFDPGSGAVGGSVLSVAVQPDSKVVLGGYFETVNGVAREGLARLNGDGSLDLSFDPGSGADDQVSSVAVQSDGKILVAGFFTSVNGVTHNAVARLNADGSLDAGFSPAVTGSEFGAYGSSVTLQANGKIVLAGNFIAINGVTRGGIARLNADGSLDTSFDPGSGADDSVRPVRIQPDGKLVIGGYFKTFNGVARTRLARLNADGSLDPSFDPGSGATGSDPERGASGDVYALALQTDGKVLVGGYFDTVGGVTREAVARLAGDPVPVPAVTSAATASAEVGKSFSYQITASNSPVRFAVSGLPPGLSLNSATGLIAGVPTQTGTCSVGLSAANAGGTGTATLTLNVTAAALPVVTLVATTSNVTAGTGNVAVLTLGLSAPQATDTVIAFTIKGTAVNGTDYVLLKASKKIKAGKTSKPIKILPLGNGGGPGTKRTVVLALQPGAAYTVGTTGKVKAKIVGQ